MTPPLDGKAIPAAPASLSRPQSPTYHGKRLLKGQAPAELLAEMRRLHPGKPFYCHASFREAVPDADDLTVIFGAQPGELWTAKEESR